MNADKFLDMTNASREAECQARTRIVMEFR
jgi:hypothetical protein